MQPHRSTSCGIVWNDATSPPLPSDVLIHKILPLCDDLKTVVRFAVGCKGHLTLVEENRETVFAEWIRNRNVKTKCLMMIEVTEQHKAETIKGDGKWRAIDILLRSCDEATVSGFGLRINREVAVHASKAGNVCVVRALMPHLLQDDEVKNITTHAIINGHAAVVEMLCVQFGVNVHAVRALQIAALYGHATIVEMLLTRFGADVHTEYDASLRFAAQNGHVEVVEILCAHFGGYAHAMDLALRIAASHGHATVVEMLCARFFGVDANVHAKNLALRAAIHNGHLAVVGLLCARFGANVHTLDEEDRPVSMNVLSAYRDKACIFTSFLQYGERFL